MVVEGLQEEGAQNVTSYQAYTCSSTNKECKTNDCTSSSSSSTVTQDDRHGVKKKKKSSTEAVIENVVKKSSKTSQVKGMNKKSVTKIVKDGDVTLKKTTKTSISSVLTTKLTSSSKKVTLSESDNSNMITLKNSEVDSSLFLNGEEEDLLLSSTHSGERCCERCKDCGCGVKNKKIRKDKSSPDKRKKDMMTGKTVKSKLSKKGLELKEETKEVVKREVIKLDYEEDVVDGFAIYSFFTYDDCLRVSLKVQLFFPPSTAVKIYFVLSCFITDGFLSGKKIVCFLSLLCCFHLDLTCFAWKIRVYWIRVVCAVVSTHCGLSLSRVVHPQVTTGVAELSQLSEWGLTANGVELSFLSVWTLYVMCLFMCQFVSREGIKWEGGDPFLADWE